MCKGTSTVDKEKGVEMFSATLNDLGQVQSLPSTMINT